MPSQQASHRITKPPLERCCRAAVDCFPRPAYQVPRAARPSSAISFGLAIAVGLLLTQFCAVAAAFEELRPLGPTQLWTDAEPLHALSVAGQPHTPGQVPGSRGVVLVVLGSQCPIARKYIPELNRLVDEFAGQGVEFYGVLSEPHLGRGDAQRFVAEFQPNFPVLFDASLLIARRLSPTHTPEAFVAHPSGVLVYRGRIDDRFADLGQPRAVTQHRELRDSVAACLAGQAAPETAPPVGCRFEAITSTAAARPPTYHRDVAPLLAQHCAACHRPGEVAPFALVSYDDAAQRSQQLVEVVSRRLMPPWKAVPGHGRFAGQRRLSTAEIELLVRWAAGGAPPGPEEDAPPLPQASAEWRLGTPDLVLEMPEPLEIPADGANVFRWFALPVALSGEPMVTAFEFQAGNSQVVHHAIMFLDNTGAAAKLDARDPGPGYESFGGPGFLPTGYLGSWAPGVGPNRLPEGTGVAFRPGTVVALQMHYTPTGRPERDRSRVGLHFAKNPSGLASVSTIPVFNVDIEIPPGQADHVVTASFRLPVPVRVIGYAPHMHYLGRRMSIRAEPPDAGMPLELLEVDDWDFNWQDQYRCLEPVALPTGTLLTVEAHYDNTADNPANPHLPPRVVQYGSQSHNEMCLAGIQVALEKPSDFLTIASALIKQFMESRRGKPFVNPFE